MDKNTNNLTAAEKNELDEFAGEHKKAAYHANHMITDKVIDPKSPLFGKKGESFYMKSGDQYYFKPKMKVPEYIEVEGEEVKTGKMVDNTEFFRMQWWQLESNILDGSFGLARYKGINGSIFGKEGELFYTAKKWVFHFDGEKYPLNNPESVTLLEG